MRYSLAKYILTVSIPKNLVSAFGAETISVGGEGSYTDSISVEQEGTLWTTEADATGSWIHNQNLDRHGTATVTLNQLSIQVAKFKTLCNLYFNASADYDGLTLTLSDTAGQIIATCDDCLITKIPAQEFRNQAGTQNWTFTCGKITFK